MPAATPSPPAGPRIATTPCGTHTCAAAARYAVQVTISHVLGSTTSATASGTATVSDVGVGVQSGQAAGIGFWHNKNGQALINSFNGGGATTALALNVFDGVNTAGGL